jgi:ABC-type uncharacterized transport system permease subunit
MKNMPLSLSSHGKAAIEFKNECAGVRLLRQAVSAGAHHQLTSMATNGH